MYRSGCVRQLVYQVEATAAVILTFTLLTVSFRAQGTVLWSQPGTILVRDNGKGQDILHGAIKPAGLQFHQHALLQVSR